MRECGMRCPHLVRVCTDAGLVERIAHVSFSKSPSEQALCAHGSADVTLTLDTLVWTGVIRVVRNVACKVMNRGFLTTDFPPEPRTRAAMTA